MSTEADQVEAVLAALETGSAAPYTVEQIKRVSVKPPAYNEVTVYRRFGGAFRNTSTTRTRGYRISIVSMGRTHDAAEEMRQLARTALEDARLTIVSEVSTPIHFETEDAIDDEDGWYSGPSLYTYTI